MSAEQERTRKSLMDDFEIIFSEQFRNGNFSKAKNFVAPVVYTDEKTFWAFQAWVASYETYAGYVIS